MDAKTNIKKRLPSRHMTEGSERAPHRSSLRAMGHDVVHSSLSSHECSGAANAALQLSAIARDCSIKFDLFDATEIFKKTPYIAGLKSGGRYVAKDMFEIGGIPLPMKTLLDNGHLHGDCLTVGGRTVVEIDADVGTLNVKLTDEELAERETKWTVRETKHTSGALWKYARQIGPVVDGAVTYPGGAHEKQCYADI